MAFPLVSYSSFFIVVYHSGKSPRVFWFLHKGLRCPILFKNWFLVFKVFDGAQKQPKATICYVSFSNITRGLFFIFVSPLLFLCLVKLIPRKIVGGNVSRTNNAAVAAELRDSGIKVSLLDSAEPDLLGLLWKEIFK